MRLETFPLVLGVLSALIALALLFDAWAPDSVVSQERRRLPREDRDRKGEALLGLGALSMAAALLGRDAWRYNTLAVIAGVILLLWGVKRNAHYLHDAFTRTARRKTTFVPGARRVR